MGTVKPVTMKTPITITLLEPIGPAVVTQNPGRMSGTPCFVGTRVPVDALLENLAAGETIDEILENFPTITKEVALEALRQACILLNLFATTVPDQE